MSVGVADHATRDQLDERARDVGEECHAGEHEEAREERHAAVPPGSVGTPVSEIVISVR